jgi:hypothetical protein
MKWLLICNPRKWFEENSPDNIEVNKLLSMLGNSQTDYETELWRLNTSLSMKMDEKIEDNDFGIIKVSH